MGSPVISDFNLDSERNCFFCLNKILLKEHELGTTSQFQKLSVHYLARYLEMDMGKVLIEEGQRDSALLAKVRKSRLKVELCEKCTSLNNTFSGLYRQLEKLEIEIKSSLKLIQDELMGADRSGATKRRLSSSKKNELSQIVDVLRDEAIHKCSQKLLVVTPRVQIEKLTKKQIDAELSKHQTNSGVPPTDPEILSPEQCMEFDGNVKTELGLSEHHNEDFLSDGEHDSRNCDMDIEAMDDEHVKTTNCPRVTSANDKNLETIDRTNDNSLVIISDASTSTEKVGKGKYKMDPETRRWKCSDCPVELTTYSGIQLHFQSIHQKIRYKCVPCGREFASPQNYRRHHQSVHVGVRFKCLVCNKLFSDRSNLMAHQRRAGCKIEPG